MKKSSAFIFFAIIILTASSCKTADDYDESKISVIATIFAPYDFTREIAGDNINLKMLLPPGSESHSYEPSPRDIININNCDIFIYTGGDSDAWAQTVLDSIDISGMQTIALMDYAELYEQDHYHYDDEKYDGHVWTSPANAQLIVKKISELLCYSDPDNAEIYEENTRIYL
jgi:zinc transport system substrate-binding protein